MVFFDSSERTLTSLSSKELCVILVSGNDNSEAHGEGDLCLLLISVSYCLLLRPVW